MTNRPGPDHSLGYALWHAALAWRAEVQAALEPSGLTPTQFFVLGSVGALGRRETPTQRDVARHAGLDAMTTSQVVRALADRGLLVRTDHPADQRAFRLALTPEGRALVVRAAAEVRAVDRAFAAAVPDPEGLREALATLKQRRSR